MAAVAGRNVRRMFLIRYLAVIFGIKLSVSSQLYRVPKKKFHITLDKQKAWESLEVILRKSRANHRPATT